MDRADDSSRNDPPFGASRRCSDEIYVEQREMKLYLKIRTKLGRYFPNWRGRANKHNLDYEKYWRFGEWALSAVIDNAHERVRSGTKFPKQGRSSLEKNRFQKWSGDYPLLRRNVTYEGIVELVDLFPSLADLAGIQKVPVCQSRSVSRKLDDGSQTLPFHVKDRIEGKLCTEGRSLSSIIIDNSIMKRSRKNIVKPNHRYFSPHKDYIQDAIPCSDDKKISRKASSSSNVGTLFALLARSTSLSSEHVRSFDTQFDPSTTHVSHQWPRNTSTDNFSTSYSNITIKPSEILWIASKQKQTPHHHLLLPSASPTSQLSYSRCAASLSGGRVGLSQYPRPSLTPSQHPDSDQPRLAGQLWGSGTGFLMRCLNLLLLAGF